MTQMHPMRGKQITLPSGETVVIRGVGFDALLLSDRVPDFLTPLVSGAINGQMITIPNVDNTDVEKTKEMARFLNLICELAFVSPRIVENPQAADEISVDDVSLSDKQYLFFNILGKPTRWLENFRHQQAQNVADLGNGEGLSDPTEQVSEAEAAPEAG